MKADAGVEEHPSVTEAKIRDVIRQNLQMSREVPIIKVRRTPNGPTVRGSKPVTVCFEKWGDKDEILRKANLVTMNCCSTFIKGCGTLYVPKASLRLISS